MPTDGPSPMSQTRMQQSEEAEPAASENRSLVDRLRGARERVQRAEKSKRADQRAAARGDSDQDGKRSETVQEARGLASDAKQLFATEFGVDEEDAGNLIRRGSEILSAAGGRIDELDTDGDGDTDILASIEEGVEAQADQNRRNQPPVGDIEDDFDEVGAPGVEGELGFDYPIEDDL